MCGPVSTIVFFFFFLMIRRPPRSTPFPTRRSSDLSAIPAGAESIDLSKFTGLPGLIDVHTHMTIYTDETPGEPKLKQRSEEHTSELQSRLHLVCRLLLEKKKEEHVHLTLLLPTPLS